MRRLLSIILISVLLTVSFTLPCIAATNISSTNISATVPEGFTVYTKDRLPSTSTELEELDQTYDEFKADFDNLGYVFFAHSTALKCNITLSEQKTRVSNTIKNLYFLKDQDQIENAGRLLLGEMWDKAFRIKQVEKDCALFFRVEMYQKDSSNIMYISVIDSVTYTLCLTNLDGVPSENVISAFEGIFNGLSYVVPEIDVKEDVAVTKGKMTIYTIVIAVCVVVAVALVFSIVKEIGQNKLNNKRSDSVKKYKKPLR